MLLKLFVTTFLAYLIQVASFGQDSPNHECAFELTKNEFEQVSKHDNKDVIYNSEANYICYFSGEVFSKQYLMAELSERRERGTGIAIEIITLTKEEKKFLKDAADYVFVLWSKRAVTRGSKYRQRILDQINKSCF